MECQVSGAKPTASYQAWKPKEVPREQWRGFRFITGSNYRIGWGGIPRVTAAVRSGSTSQILFGRPLSREDQGFNF